MLKKEVINFYAEKGLHITKMIARRPGYMSPEQIEAGSVAVYNEIKNGLNIRNRLIAGRVKEAGRIIEHQQYIEDRKLITDAKEVIAEKDSKFRRVALLAVVLSVLTIINLILRWL